VKNRPAADLPFFEKNSAECSVTLETAVSCGIMLSALLSCSPGSPQSSSSKGVTTDMTIPTLATSRLILRAFTAEDVDPMFRIINEEGVLRYFPGTGSLARDRVQGMIDGLLKHWADRGYGLWAVESPASGELMGRCGLQWLPDTEEVEVDFVLAKPFWGQGFATEAARASVQFGFDQLRLDRIIGIVHVDNEASKRVLEKLGMALLEQKEFFGIECYRLAVDRPAYESASASWASAARDGASQPRDKPS
jgi:ribosomal-protein-alanine N-acetyltransferase